MLQHIQPRQDGAARKAKTAAKAHIRRIGDMIEALPDAAFAGDK